MKLILVSCIPALSLATIFVVADNIHRIPDGSWPYITGVAAIVIALLWPRR
jgi:hypothetical protein